MDPLAEFESSFTSDRILPGFGDGETSFEYRRPSLPALTITVPDASIKQLFAHRQWRAGIRMADLIADGTHSMVNETVIEMGAGTGLPGILSVLRGAHMVFKQVVITDYDDPAILRTLRQNVSSSIPADLRSRCKIYGHTWGTSTEDLLDLVAEKYSRVICSDVLWDQFSHSILLDSLCALLSHNSAARILVISGLHTGRGPLARFLRQAQARGLVPDAEPYEIEVSGERRSWDEDRPDGDIQLRNRWTLEFNLKWSPDRLIEFQAASN